MYVCSDFNTTWWYEQQSRCLGSNKKINSYTLASVFPYSSVLAPILYLC